MEKEKSSRKDRESTKEREHKHRSSKDKSRDAASDEDDNRHHHRHRSKHRGGDDEDDRRRSDNRHRRHSEEDSFDRERSTERHRSEREGSLDRREKSHDRDKRERSHERETKREESVERRHFSKRKERGDSEDRNDGAEKRARVSEGKNENGKEKEDRRERRRFDDGEVKEERRERKRFEDKVKQDDMGVDEERMEREFQNRTFKKEEPVEDAQHVDSVANGLAMESSNKAPRTLPETSLAPVDPPATKVSSISTNENKGVNINRSHEVPGKSSTDGTASGAGKRAGFSLDALAKAKRALQMQKELAEKLKKIPTLNKGAGPTREGSQQVGATESHKASSSSAGVQPALVASSNSGILPTPASSAPSTLDLPAGASVNLPPSGLPHLAGLTAQKYEAVKRAQELAAKMGFRQDPEFAPLINMFPGQMPQEVTIQPKPAKAPVLRLDALGREIDEQGNVVNMPKPSSTLKVNINKKKKDAFQILKPELEVDPDENPHFDARMGLNKNKILRPKRMSFQFVEEGKWSRDAEIIKLKSQFGEARAKELKAKQAQLAKAKAEPDINPNLIEVSQRVFTQEKQKEPIPEVEWWDVPILQSGAYGDITDGNISHDKLRMEMITIYVQHPRPIEPPAEPAPPPPQPLKLTKKEQKKLRTQRRLAREKDKQEMIRQGLLEPPKPKVKMSNLMKVLGSEATQDPTKLEMEIRSAAAEREQAHIDRNIARKLTPDERREKKERKLFDDPNTTLETIVSVYKINDLSHPQTRFKVDVNAQENRMTGCAVISDGISVVAVEGGKKAIKRYGKLMLRRIDWAAAVKQEEDEDEDEDEEKPINKCVLVWQGSVAKPSFHKFFVHECRTEAAARKIFADAGVPHYWDLAVNFKDEEL
nr:U4/U6 small nuclear ribonucleoprotein Prp3 [Ipomoea trifida]